ncbi:amino acid permease-domain-containing protein [Aspergillus pseudonomiae]|uniref:Amino acid permease-domain-containing protein n=1 Tax=Aspergillus pseudonomiae TaxID=1506151 RepID=A0A5N7D2C2_9EURO|nr:amino acid permease-domain-containing protein [Aspergillus pseudonomiae]KAB8265014.1 amino acid permease-domain-containing protein [Aspergillus pseudonomiae]KAE8400555.1 amino acid permease-domain-containing protein [Aspergillus pseudonomiae]
MSDNPRFEHSGTVDEKALENNNPKDNASFTDIANATTFETYGHVQRDLKARHVTFIALGGNLGTGLFLGIGRALRTSGPLSLFLGYAIASSAGFMMMMALGEMAAWLPLPGAIPQFCARYVDDALGFAVRWNTCVAVWIVILIVALLALNILAVKVYGEAEFACAVIKLCGIIGLLITALVIDLGGVPTQNRLGFHYWKTDGIMKEYIASGSTGRFLGLFSTLVNASFSLGGVETVVVAAGEAENPRRNIPRAIRRVFWRLLFFFVLASFALGLICPSNNSRLLGDSSSSNAESPWVIAINLAGIKALPSIVNVVVLIAGISSGNSYQAPRIFLRCTEQGIPIYALLVTMSISFLTFMSMGSSSNIPYSTYFTLIYLCIVVFFNGFDSIAGGFNLPGFITSYIGFPLFFGFFLFWKILKRTKWKRPEEADLFTGKAELDAIEWARKIPRNFVERVWLAFI